jgi:hypothetical protein
MVWIAYVRSYADLRRNGQAAAEILHRTIVTDCCRQVLKIPW